MKPAKVQLDWRKTFRKKKKKEMEDSEDSLITLLFRIHDVFSYILKRNCQQYVELMVERERREFGKRDRGMTCNTGVLGRRSHVFASSEISQLSHTWFSSVRDALLKAQVAPTVGWPFQIVTVLLLKGEEKKVIKEDVPLQWTYWSSTYHW